jgi:hypothetical protein
MMSTATFELKPWAFVVYSLVFGIAGLAAVGYVDPEMRLAGFDGLVFGFYGHASNVLISYAVIVVYGTIRLVMGAKICELAVATGVIVAANYVYEVGLTLWNTKDLADAHWGAASSLLTLALLAAIHRFGVKPAVSASVTVKARA